MKKKKKRKTKIKRSKKKTKVKTNKKSAPQELIFKVTKKMVKKSICEQKTL